jgi:hypothetical protein
MTSAASHPRPAVSGSRNPTGKSTLWSPGWNAVTVVSCYSDGEAIALGLDDPIPPAGG